MSLIHVAGAVSRSAILAQMLQKSSHLLLGTGECFDTARLETSLYL